jgi:Primase C terminal 2 (PriCT-2)/Bifunctional DNA primase/polymerase, N-terminal
MFSFPQKQQAFPQYSDLKIPEYQGNLHRSQERLIQGLLRIPSHWKLIPCINKIPLGKKWQQNYYSPQFLLRSLLREGKVWVSGKKGLYQAVPNGYSLLCGYQKSDRDRFLVAIDCDSGQALSQFQGMNFPTTVSYSSGRPGRAQFLYYVDRPIKSFKLGNGLEVRGENLLSTLPPSVHPITGEYHWLVAPDKMKIPTVSSIWVEYLRPKLKVQLQERKRQSNKLKTVEELVYAINPLYADIYDDWIRVGMALKDWNEGLLGVWDEWSRNSSKYKPGECAYRWSSFNGTGVTFRTIYYYAKIS